nr:AAA family ATPase [Tessaracoccus coleopterorum]
MLDVLVGPAGAGKTTAMNALRRAWEAEHGPGSVVGLAPSAVAAQVLADDLGIATENTAKWWQNHLLRGTTFETGQLVIIDEASLAGTLSLDRITYLAQEAGAKVLLVGDYAQLQSVDAGGAFAMIANDRDDTPELVDVHRFTHAWEKTASLELRHGRTQAIDSYLAHQRITGGDAETMTDAAYNAWRADRDKGLVSVLIAETHEDVTELNRRARADLIHNKTLNPDREVELRDGTAAGVGDTIITRLNNRRLRTVTGRDWVRNGDVWTITAVGDDGTLTIARDYGTGTTVREDGTIAVRKRGRRFGSSIILPASYVSESVDLGYAVTAFRAQGVTTDTAHVLVEPTSTRETFYVAMTRGRHSNRAYVALDRPDDHAEPHPATILTRLREACFTVFSSTVELNSRRTKRSSLNRSSGDRSPSSPQSTRPSPPQPNATAGSHSSAAPDSPTTRPTVPSNPRHSDRSRPNSAALRPTTTMSTRCCRVWSQREGSATPTTSRPSSTTASNERPLGSLGQDEPGGNHDSSPASSHKPTA